MKPIRTLLFTALLLCGAGSALRAQSVALKHNLAYDAILTPNLSLEVATAPRWTLDLQAGANFFFYNTQADSPKYTTTKWSHYLIQPEARYWFCDVFNGWFLGMHALGGQMNVGGVSIPFILQNKNNVMKDHRYEGWFLGGGVSAGYQHVLNSYLSLEASLGVGYASVWYDRFQCVVCGEKDGTGRADYVGPTKATLSLVYMF